MEIAFIIECNLDIDPLKRKEIRVQRKTSCTKFGDIVYSLFSKISFVYPYETIYEPGLLQIHRKRTCYMRCIDV